MCPLIEESEQLQLKTALETFETIKTTFPDLAVGLVHGRLKPAEKAQVMADFKAKKIQLLVATTVIEVGVDVPNATLMVIEHAERMGLAQLHQLRGRVGRGTQQSLAILLYYQPLSELARQRLKVIYENSDGFEIARQDLALRGPGEFLGARQSGAPLLRFADLERDVDLLEQARTRGRRAPRRARARRHPPPRPLARHAPVLPQGMNPKLAKLSQRLDAYERLVRLDRPIGILLLLWPTLWALWLARHGIAAARGARGSSCSAPRSCARRAARSTTGPTAISTPTCSARASGRSPRGEIAPWEALAVAAVLRGVRVRRWCCA